MKRVYKLALKIGLAGAILLMSTGTASALVTQDLDLEANELYYIAFANRAGSADDDIILCNATSDAAGDVYVLFDNVATNNMSDNVLVKMGAEANQLEVIIGNKTDCNGGLSLEPVGFNGKTITIDGEGGSDILTGGSGATVLNGLDDGDDLTVRHATGSANGGNGRDRVRSNFSGGSEDLFGNAEGDCLQQVTEGTSPAVFNCGDQSTDRYNPPASGTYAHCEDFGISIGTDNCAYPVTY
jgi:hypothetical protein